MQIKALTEEQTELSRKFLQQIADFNDQFMDGTDEDYEIFFHNFIFFGSAMAYKGGFNLEEYLLLAANYFKSSEEYAKEAGDDGE